MNLINCSLHLSNIYIFKYLFLDLCKILGIGIYMQNKRILIGLEVKKQNNINTFIAT